MKYKLVVFDFDGTLADTFPWVSSMAGQITQKYGFGPVPESEYETLRGLSAREIFKYLGIPWWKAPLIANYVRKLLTKEIGKVALFPGVDNLLATLANQQAVLAILSTNSFANISKVLGPDNTALIEHFECGASIFSKRSKLRKILKNSKVPAGQAIYIGDEIRDCEAATQEGVAFGAVSWGYTRLEALQTCSPGEVFTRVDQISETVLATA